MQRPRGSAALAAKMQELEELTNHIDTLTEQLSELKARRKTLGEDEITEQVTEDEVQHSGVVFEDGSEWTFEREVRCGILKEERPAAYEWLRTHRSDWMLKRYLILSFGKDSADAVAKVREMIAQVLPQYEIGLKIGRAPETLVDAVREILTKADLLPRVKMTEELELPGATLASFARKCVTAGITLPPSFGIYAPLKPVRVNAEPVTTIVDDTAAQTEAAV